MIASYSLPGGKVALRKGDASVVLLWAATQWHQHVEPLRWPGVWGYASRNVRGSATDLSNHASGTAIDLNAPAHPLGTAPSDNFSPAQIAAIRAIVAQSRGVLRWGGDYTGRKDGMHLELNAGGAAVAAFADELRAGTPAAAPTPRRDIVIDNREVTGSGDLRLICPVGRASAMTGRAWLSAAVNGPEQGTVRGWFQTDTGGISDFAWTIGFADGHSDRPWIEFPDGATQVNVQYEMPDGGVICLEANPK